MLDLIRDSALTLASQGPAGIQAAITLLIGFPEQEDDWERDFYLGYFNYQLGK